MLDNDKGMAAIFWNVVKNRSKGLQSTCAGTYCNYDLVVVWFIFCHWSVLSYGTA